MIIKPPELESINGHTKIWHYMALDKFIDLLITKKLYFNNLSKTTDGYEGLLPRRNIAKIEKTLASQGRSQIQIENHIRESQYIFQKKKEQYFINCWSCNRTESYAFWKIYLGNSTSGVAIKSTISNLKRSILAGSKNQNIIEGKINYSDYIQENEESFNKVAYTKNKYYESENEYRLAVQENVTPSLGVRNAIKSGLGIDVDLDLMIDQIYLSPFAGSWFNTTFTELVAKINTRLVNRIVASDVRDQ